MAGGYNSFHESVQTGLPTISFPNMNTGRDDQLARVKVGEEAGCMVESNQGQKEVFLQLIGLLTPK